MNLARRTAAEFVGTAFLLAAIVGSGIMAERLSGGNVALALLCNSIATGAALIVLISVFLPISGAHFNPLVSMAQLFRSDLSARDAAGYVAAQLAGAVMGVWITHAMFEVPLFQLSTTIRTGSGQWLAEAVATFGLILIVLMSSQDRVAISVGLYIAAAYWFTASTSFANPAVTVARSLSDSFAGIAPQSAVAFIIAQIAGALIAIPAVSAWMKR